MTPLSLTLPLLLFLSILSRGAAAEIVPNLPQAKHNLHLTNAVSTWDEALPLGNGILGALVWGDGHPLKISLDRTDLWDLTPVPEFHSSEYNLATVQRWHKEGRHQELIKLLEQPYNRPAPTRIPAGRIELDLGPDAAVTESTLSLLDATALVRCGNKAEVAIFLDATRPVGFIRVRGSTNLSPRLVAPAFGGKVQNAAAGGIGAGDLAQLNYPPPVVGTNATSQSFFQKGANDFSYAGFLKWRLQDGEWLAAWSLASSFEGSDPLSIARNRVEQALQDGFESAQKSHQQWWLDFWKRSSVSLPNAVLERQWFLETYKFGSAARSNAPPITLQGPWTADDGQLPPWKGDYHHDLNTQLSYWPCYSGNHLDEGLAYLNWLWATRSNCFAWTRRFYGFPGLNVPMTTDLNNEQIGGWRQYTHSFTTAAWLAQHFYLHWKYSADEEFLRERAWPYLRDASIFIEAATVQRDKNGHRSLPLSSSPEINDNLPEAWFDQITNYDLSLVRWLFDATAELAQKLQLHDEADRWRRVQSEFPPLALSEEGALLVAPGRPLRESHRHFSHLMAIHPLGLVDIHDGPDSRRIIDSSLRDSERLGSDAWCGYSFSWLGNIWARALNGEKAERALEIFSTAFTLRNSFHANGDQSGKGYSKFTYRPFTLEGNFAAAAGIQEMLLQSHRGRIEIFPAVPNSWSDIAFTTLRAEGAFLVSAERKGGVVQRVHVLAEKGGEGRLLSPWTGQELRRPLKKGETWSLTAQSEKSNATVADSPDPIRVLIVTGIDYPGHHWQKTTPVLQEELAKDPRLRVSVLDDPYRLDTFDLSSFDTLVLHFMNWEKPDPNDKAKENLRGFVERGGGLTILHFACGAFQGWPEFASLAGRIYDRTNTHDPRGPFTVNIINQEHPITQGMGKSFETDDELYTCLTGDKPIELLATARSKITARDHPMGFVHEYGKGRVFLTPLGHDVKAFRAEGTAELIRRATAWTARRSPLPGRDPVGVKTPTATSRLEEKFRLPDGFRIRLVAAEPDIINPMSLSVDEQGVLWVTEAHTYRWGTNGSPYQPPANPIKRIELGKDGRGARTSSALQGFPEPVIGVHVRHSKLYATCLNELFSMDIAADGTLSNRKLLVKDAAVPWNPFGMYRVQVGPDDKLWLCIADHPGSKPVTLTGSDGRNVRLAGQSGGMVRCNLDGSGLEVIVEGFRAPYAFDLDPWGHLWHISNGEGSPNIYVHVIPGLNYGYASREVSFAWLAGREPLAPPVLDLGAGANTAALHYYSAQFPSEFWGSVLIANWGSHGANPGNREIKWFRRLKDGQDRHGTSDSELVDSGKFLTSDDPMFRPTGLVSAPDGGLYLIDWHGRDDENDTSGRIYHISYHSTLKLPPPELSAVLNLDAAIQNLSHRHHLARRQASDFIVRAGESALSALTPILEKGDPLAAAEAIWILSRIGSNQSAQLLTRALKNSDCRVRALALRQLRQFAGQSLAGFSNRDKLPAFRCGGGRFCRTTPGRRRS